MQKEYVFGFHAVYALLENTPENVHCIYLHMGRVDKNVQQIMNLANVNAIPVRTLSNDKLRAMVGDVKHQGIVAMMTNAPKLYDEKVLPDLIASKKSAVLLLVLDGIQDPHNLGACLRTANVAGVTAVIAPKDNAVGLTPIVRKVASGAAETTPFIQVTNLARTLKLLKELNIWLYGACERAKQNIYNTKFAGSMALVLGAEGKGMRRLTQESCDFLVKIPMFGNIPSLNVSVATGICLFEVVRQRQLAEL